MTREEISEARTRLEARRPIFEGSAMAPSMEVMMRSDLRKALDALDRVLALCDTANALESRAHDEDYWKAVGSGDFLSGRSPYGSSPYETKSGEVFALRSHAVHAAIEGL